MLMEITVSLELDCRWYKFEDAPAGSYACVHAPEGKLEGAKLSWMPLAREQITAHARVGMVLPIPELNAASPFGQGLQKRSDWFPYPVKEIDV